MSFNKPGANNGNVAAGFGNFLGPTVNTDSYGLLHSFNIIGGFTEMPSIADRDAIPVYDNGIGTHTGFTAGVDGYSTGRRRIGMLVYVMETKKIYQLLPKGYFGNQGDATFADFNNLTEWDRARLLHPTATNIFNNVFIPPPQGGPAYESVPITGTADDCWVEILGPDGNPITNVQYNSPNPGDLTITLTHDGSGGGTPIAFTVNIPSASNIYNSNLAGTIAMVDDVGGMPAGTLVSDLDGIKTYDELFDTILFPTSYPTASQPSVQLTDTFSLREIGEVLNVPLSTSANRGQITLDGSNQGPYAGSVTSATITGPGGPYTLNVGPNPTDIDNHTVTSHTVVEGTAGNQWTLTATFAQGPMPLDSTGADYPSLQFAGGNKSNSTNFEGVYPIFLGNAGGGFDQAPLVSHSFGVSVTSNVIQCDQLYAENASTSLYHRISIPNDMIDGRSIEVYQLNPVSGNYDEATGGWVQTADVNRTIQGNSVAYTLLTSSVQVTLGNNYRIKFV